MASDAQLGFSQVPAWAAQAMLQNKPACVVYCRRTPTRLAGGKLLHSRSRFYESIWENSKNDIAAILFSSSINGVRLTAPINPILISERPSGR